MVTLNLLAKYLGRLVRQWGALALLVVDVIAFAFGLATDRSLPQVVYWVVLVVSVLWASFQIYTEQEREKEEQRRLYEDKLDALNRKLQDIEGQRPELELHFQTDQGFVDHLVLTIPPYPEPPDIEEEIRKAQSALAYKPPKATLAGLGSFLMSQPTPEQLGEYNERAERYVNELRKYLEYKYLYDILVCRAHAIRLAVDNTGKRPAHDVTLLISFPDELRTVSKDDLPDRPEVPQKPRLPRGILDILDAFGGLSAGIPLPGSYFPSDIELPSLGGNVSGPYISEGHSTQVRYEIKTLMHNIPEADLDPFFVIVPEERVDRVFDIPYEIHASELPDPVRGGLTVTVQYE
jgi:hypothetical protein